MLLGARLFVLNGCATSASNAKDAPIRIQGERAKLSMSLPNRVERGGLSHRKSTDANRLTLSPNTSR